MSDSSSSTVTIDAPLAAVTEALFALEKYPEWSSSIKAVEAIARDDQGRITKVKMTIDAGMMKDRVILDYDWSAAPHQLTFTLDDADMLTEMTGGYTLVDNGDDTTTVTYELTVALSMPVPAMMRTKAERDTIELSLKELKEKLEA